MIRAIHQRAERVLTFAVAFSLIVSLIPAGLVKADTLDKLYITPSSSQMNIGTTFTVNVRSYADTDQSVGNTSGTVTYPTGLLKVTAISVSGSGYGSPSISQGNGTIGFSGSRNPAPAGSAQIFAVTFQATGAGNAAVGFSGDSQVNNSQTQYSSGVYSITNPAPAPSQPSPKPKASSAPKVVSPVPVVTTPVDTPAPATLDQPQPQPTPDPTGVIDSVNVTPTYTAGTVTWKVNADNAASTLAYGSTESNLDRSASVTKAADGSFSTTISNLSPGVRYFFTINGSGNGGKSGTYSGTIITQGYPVSMTITENNVPVQSGQVKIGEQSHPIGSDGKVTFGLASGSYSGTITTSTASLAINLTVKEEQVPTDGSAPALQTFGPYNLTSSVLDQGPGSGFSILGFIGVLLGGTAFLAIGFVGFMAYRRRKFEGGYSSKTPGATVIVEDGYDWRQEAIAQQATDAPPPSPAASPTMEMPVQAAQHMNSVHLTEEEPLDMFDRAAQLPLPPASHQVLTSTEPVPGQSPNLPHSTTP